MGLIKYLKDIFIEDVPYNKYTENKQNISYKELKKMTDENREKRIRQLSSELETLKIVIMNKYEIAIIAHKDKERCKRLKEEINKLEKEYDLKEEELKILKNYKKKWWE